MPQLIIASANPHKIAKLKKIFEPYFSNIKSLLDYPRLPKSEESGITFAENARTKALSISKELHTTVIATDGGASIPGLSETWNALYTHRFIGENRTDEERVRKLLEMMSGKLDRRVWFTEAYALCKDGEVLFELELDSPVGYLKEVWDGRMKPGAWLLSLWYLPDRNKDFFDLTADEVKEVENTWAALKKRTDSFFANK